MGEKEEKEHFYDVSMSILMIKVFLAAGKKKVGVFLLNYYGRVCFGGNSKDI